MLPVPDEACVFVCRMCERLAEAFDRGGETCGERECGGLDKGRGFPRYKGPLAPGTMKAHCFRCGKPSEQVVEITSNEGTVVLGVCTACTEVLKFFAKKS